MLPEERVLDTIIRDGQFSEVKKITWKKDKNSLKLKRWSYIYKLYQIVNPQAGSVIVERWFVEKLGWKGIDSGGDALDNDNNIIEIKVSNLNDKLRIKQFRLWEVDFIVVIQIEQNIKIFKLSTDDLRNELDSGLSCQPSQKGAVGRSVETDPHDCTIMFDSRIYRRWNDRYRNQELEGIVTDRR